MAKKFYTKYEIIHLSRKQLDNMNERELRKVVSSARSIARKRYERLEEKGLKSPAAGLLMKRWEKEGYEVPFPTVSKMDKITLRNELRRYMGFINARSSSVPEARKIMEAAKEEAYKITGVSLDDDATVEFFKLYDSAKDTEVGKVLQYVQVREVTNEVYLDENNKNLSQEELLEKVEKRLNEIYERENPTAADYPSKFYNQTAD